MELENLTILLFVSDPTTSKFEAQHFRHIQTVEFWFTNIIALELLLVLRTAVGSRKLLADVGCHTPGIPSVKLS